MSECCDGKNVKPNPGDPCSPPEPCGESTTGKSRASTDCPLTWFKSMTPHCLDYATRKKQEGSPIVGIMCEYTPRELIMAAGAVPVCLCGGSAKTIPSAEEDLPANLCPLIKSTYGYHKLKSNPFLEMADLIVAETTCDGKKKMYELLGQERTTCILELPQKPDDPDAFEHWVSELKKFRGRLEELFEVEITSERLAESISILNMERKLRRDLAALMKADTPPLTGRELLDLKSSISGIPCDFKQYERALEVLPGRVPADDISSRVRVLLTGVPIVHGAERVMDIIEGHGGLVVCQDNCTGLKPILDDVKLNSGDPIRALAEKYFSIPCSVMTKNTRRTDTLGELAREYRPQCIIDLVWQACLTYDVESYFVRKLAEEELGIPYLRIETDYSPSDSARIAVRVEALFETIHRKAGA